MQSNKSVFKWTTIIIKKTNWFVAEKLFSLFECDMSNFILTKSQQF